MSDPNSGPMVCLPRRLPREKLVDAARTAVEINPAKAFEYFLRTQGWNEQEERDQVLTPIEESSLLGTGADPESIMCYQIPGDITRDGKPIVGGVDIDESDYGFAAKIYPKLQLTENEETAGGQTAFLQQPQVT